MHDLLIVLASGAATPVVLSYVARGLRALPAWRVEMAQATDTRKRLARRRRERRRRREKR